jgi:hypothetical protein
VGTVAKRLLASTTIGALVGLVGVAAVLGYSGSASAQSRCISAWNDLASGQYGTASDPLELTSGEGLGFVSERVSVWPTGRDCHVRFDLGGGWAYSFATVRNSESRDIEGWTGEGTPFPARQAGIVWNGCQRDDGTIEAGLHSCPPHDPQVSPRPLAAELGVNVLQGVQGNAEGAGVYPYWLGPRFRGAYPEPTASDGRQEIDYPVWYRGSHSRVYIYTYHPRLGATPTCLMDESACAADPNGGPHLLFRKDTGDVTVLVAYLSGRPPAAILDQIHAALKQTTRLQLASIHPPPTGNEPQPGHGVDPTQPERPLWFGPTLAGQRATIIHGPPGVGLVRYGTPHAQRRIYVATYRPLGATCGNQGCALAPQPPPKQILHYGKLLGMWSLDDAWVTVILAPHPHHVKLPDKTTRRPPTDARQ